MRTVAYRPLHPGSARARNRALRLAAGILSLALGAACLALAGVGAQHTLSLRQLSSEGGVLMSCADDAGPSAEPLWCADPASPHCIPALPEAPRADAWQGPVGALWSFDTPTQRRIATWITWPSPRVATLLSRRSSERLERPPRSA